MTMKSKIAKVFLYILGGIILAAVLFMLTVSIVFTAGGKTPDIFGYSVYISENDSVEGVSVGTAVIAEKVHPQDILAGYIVLYFDDDGEKNLATVTSSIVTDGVVTLSAKDSLGQEISVSQSDIVGIAAYTSDTIGSIVIFAKSPTGVSMIAILPCMLIIIYEIIKNIRKNAPPPLVETVKKQEEVPSFVPEKSIKKATVTYQKAADAEDVFFKSPAKQAEAQCTAEIAPLSQEKLNRAIEQTKAEKLRKESNVQNSAQKLMELGSPFRTESERRTTVRSAAVDNDEQPMKEYVPKSAQKKENTAHLDSMFSDDESDDDDYSVEDILKKLKKNREKL